MTDQAPKARSVRKPKGEGHVRRGEILAAAEQIFVAEGYEGATIRKIADAVGVSSTALYLHFRDKSEILNEICQHAFSILLARCQELAETETDPLVRLRKLLRSYVSFGFENTNAYRLAFMTPVGQIYADEKGLARVVAADLYASFEKGVEQALPPQHDLQRARVLAQILWASTHGLVSIVMMKPHLDWADRDDLIETQLDILLKALETQ
ncbi:TetR/AcrR family transcriptional regulator [Brevundimonas sp.]|uniref:TetR/AcrR family transcriptional regulator n=2 Tax=Brevundimonas sp. TaxID=1871086 RepID=UPI002FCADD1A